MILSFEACTRLAELREDGRMVRQWTDPLAALAWMAEHIRGVRYSRWVGYLSYDLGRLFEQVGERAGHDVELPLYMFALIEGTDQSAHQFRTAKPSGEDIAMRSTFTRSQYLDAVQRVIEYIRAGDVFQVNLSQRFSAALNRSPGQIYSHLLSAAPAWYGGLLEFPELALVSNSPELFFRITRHPETGERRIITRPIKGTRPAKAGMDRELRDSAKDLAELNMIIDLERNDLGRVCQIGSVRVTEPRVIEAHPTVYHGAATIEGILRDEYSFVDVLRAMFPGGSVTGAPKIRAMQIIEELEPVRRGPYCGAIGFLDSDGTIEFNIAIRTMIAHRGLVHISVGGGIVADSIPEAEYEETLTKAQAMFTAIGATPSH